MAEYVLRVVDRGTPNNVPVVGAYLLRVDGGACQMHTIHLGLSPKAVEALAAGLGELGVRVERVAVPAVEPPPAGEKPKVKRGRGK